MAAPTRSRGRGNITEAKSAFEKQEQFQKDGCTWLDPPGVRVASYAAAGLQGLYTQVTTQKPVLDNGTDAFTDENGVFCPKDKMPLLARRYCYLDVLGRGGSSITIRAKDTFRPNDYHVAIKVLNLNFYRLGYQESSSIMRLNKADPNDFSGTMRLLNTFSFSGHFCMVFELLDPKPLHHYFKEITDNSQKLRWIRKVAIRLLQVLGFLQQENVIHADLKPENVLCLSDDLSSGVKVIDFGNAIHCVYDELSLYYDDFELQTLLYRAPEVLFGLPFGLEIDMWSLGCILAELYIGQPLFFALSKDRLMQRMVSVLGPMPAHILQRGKFFQDYSAYTGKPQTSLATWAKLHTEMMGVQDPHFISFITSMLQYNPSDRPSVSDAFQHPFLAPEIATRYLLPPTQSGERNNYPKVGISSKTYNLSPAISPKVTEDRLSGVDLLRHGTMAAGIDRRLEYRDRVKSSGRVIAEVAPFVKRSQQNRQSHVPAFTVEQFSSSRNKPRIPAFQVPPVVEKKSSREPGSGSIGRINMVQFGSDVRQPIPVPGRFSNSLVHGKQEDEGHLSDMASIVYTRYQNSLQTSTVRDSKFVEPQEQTQHRNPANIPSTSFQGAPSRVKGNRTACTSETNSVSAGFNAANITKQKVPVNTRVLTKHKMTECVDERNLQESTPKRLKTGEQSSDDRKSRGSSGRSRERYLDTNDAPVQKGEIYLTRLTESSSTTSKEARNTSGYIANQLSSTRMYNAQDTDVEDPRHAEQFSTSKRENVLDVGKAISSHSYQLSKKKRKSETSVSPLSKWNNLEKMRAETLKRNKEDIDAESQIPNNSIKSPVLSKPKDSRAFLVEAQESSSPSTFSKQTKLLSMPKRQRFSPSPGRSSCSKDPVDTKPSLNPSTPSNLATSIAKLKSVTPTTPTNSDVLLMSEYPTPDITTMTPATIPEHSPMSDHSSENVPVLGKSDDKRTVSDEEIDSEVSEVWQEESPINMEIDRDQLNQALSSNDCKFSTKTEGDVEYEVEASKMQFMTDRRNEIVGDSLQEVQAEEVKDDASNFVQNLSNSSKREPHVTQEVPKLATRKRGKKRKIAASEEAQTIDEMKSEEGRCVRNIAERNLHSSKVEFQVKQNLPKQASRKRRGKCKVVADEEHKSIYEMESEEVKECVKNVAERIPHSSKVEPQVVSKSPSEIHGKKGAQVKSTSAEKAQKIMPPSKVKPEVIRNLPQKLKTKTRNASVTTQRGKKSRKNSDPVVGKSPSSTRRKNEAQGKATSAEKKQTMQKRRASPSANKGTQKQKTTRKKVNKAPKTPSMSQYRKTNISPKAKKSKIGKANTPRRTQQSKVNQRKQRCEEELLYSNVNTNREICMDHAKDVYEFTVTPKKCQSRQAKAKATQKISQVCDLERLTPLQVSLDNSKTSWKPTRQSLDVTKEPAEINVHNSSTKPSTSQTRTSKSPGFGKTNRSHKHLRLPNPSGVKGKKKTVVIDSDSDISSDGSGPTQDKVLPRVLHAEVQSLERTTSAYDDESEDSKSQGKANEEMQIDENRIINQEEEEDHMEDEVLLL